MDLPRHSLSTTKFPPRVDAILPEELSFAPRTVQVRPSNPRRATDRTRETPESGVASKLAIDLSYNVGEKVVNRRNISWSCLQESHPN